MVDEATTRLLEGYKRTLGDRPEAPPSGETPDRSDEWKAFEEKFDDALARRERELTVEIDCADF